MNEINLKFKNSFESCVLLNGELWYITERKSWLCKMNPQDYTAEYVCDVPYTSSDGYAYKIAGGYGTTLLMMPMYSEFLLEYDIKDNIFKKIELKKAGINGESEGGAAIKFRSSVQEENRVWILPQSSHCILEYDFCLHSVVEHTDWYQELFGNFGWSRVPLFGKGIKFMDSIWIPCFQTNAVLEYSMKKKQGCLHFVGKEEERFSAVTVCKDDLWLMDNRNRSVVRWNPKSGDTQYYDEFPNDYRIQEQYKSAKRAADWGIIGMNTIGNQILMYPSYANQFMILDADTGMIKKLADVSNGGLYIDAYKMEDNRILYLSQGCNEVGVYSIKDGTMKFVSIDIIVNISVEDLKGGIINEGELGLERYIGIVKKFC